MGEYAVDQTMSQELPVKGERSTPEYLWRDFEGAKTVRPLSNLFNCNEKSFLAGVVYRYFDDETIIVEHKRKKASKIHEIVAVSPKTGFTHIFRGALPYYEMRVVRV